MAGHILPTFKQSEGTVLQLHLHSLQGIHHHRDVQQGQNEGLCQKKFVRVVHSI